MKLKTRKKLDDIMNGNWSLHYKTPENVIQFMAELLIQKVDSEALLIEKLDVAEFKIRELKRQISDYSEIKRSLNTMTAERSKWLRKLRRAGINTSE